MLASPALVHTDSYTRYSNKVRIIMESLYFLKLSLQILNGFPDQPSFKIWTILPLPLHESKFKGSKVQRLFSHWPEWACRLQQQENRYTQMQHTQTTDIPQSRILWLYMTKLYYPEGRPQNVWHKEAITLEQTSALFPSVSVQTYDMCCVPMHINVSCSSPELSPSSPLHFHCQILLCMHSNTSCGQTKLSHRMWTSTCCSRKNAI